jgi:putative membrane protein
MSWPLAHIGGGVVEPLQIGGLLVVAGAYWWRARTLSKRGKPVPPWRQACFAVGVLLILVALASPVAHIGGELLIAHMAQHLIMGDIAALLLVLGLTGPLLAPVLRVPVLRWLRPLSHPLVALPLWTINLYAWHLPVLYQAALHSDVVHAAQHILFITLSVNMWMPLFGPLPKPEWFGNLGRLLYIIGVRLIPALLGNVLTWAATNFYPDYDPGRVYWNIQPLADQNLAGVVMMVEGSLLTLGLFCWLFLKAAKEGEERQELLDLAAANGVELSERRAARAVSAGRGDELRRRLVARA